MIQKDIMTHQPTYEIWVPSKTQNATPDKNMFMDGNDLPFQNCARNILVIKKNLEKSTHQVGYERKTKEFEALEIWSYDTMKNVIVLTALPSSGR